MNKKQNYKKPLIQRLKSFAIKTICLIPFVKHLYEMNIFLSMSHQQKRAMLLNVKGRQVKACIYIPELANRVTLIKKNKNINQTKTDLWNIYYKGGLPALQKYCKVFFKEAKKQLSIIKKIEKTK
jgi:hypothetical protein